MMLGILGSVAIGAGGARGELSMDEMTANQIQEVVRYSYSLQDATLKGQLDVKGGGKVPFSLVLKEGVVAFFFANPKQKIVLRQKKDGYTLTEESPKGSGAVSQASYGAKVRGTDVLYEDLTMRFLYWPWATKDGEDTIRTRKCVKLHIRNPKQAGPYSQVWVWVDKASGGLMKMKAFDWKGFQVKEFEVLSGQKVNGSWVLKDMNVKTFAPKAGVPKEVSRTVLRLRD